MAKRMKRLACGRVWGNRAAEIMCGLLRGHCTVAAAGRLAVNSRDVELEYLVSVEAPAFGKARVAEILAFAKGVHEALVATGMTRPSYNAPHEWGGITDAS